MPYTVSFVFILQANRSKSGKLSAKIVGSSTLA